MPDLPATAPYAALGAALPAHGALRKPATFGLAGTMGCFASIGDAPLLGARVAFGNTAAGPALLSGMLVRTAALASLPGATPQPAGQGWVSDAPGGGWEFPASLTAALLVQAGLGAGAWPLAALLTRGTGHGVGSEGARAA